MKNLLSQIPGILSKHTRFIPLLGVLALVLTVPVTLSLIEQNQDNRQQAAVSDTVVSLQQTTGGTGNSCEPDYGKCIPGDEFLSTQYRFAAAATDATYSCPDPSHVCLVQSLPTTENQTCTGQCHASAADCDTNNPGQQCTVDASGSCLSSGYSCFTVSPPTATFPPLGDPCSDGSGNYSCGFGTPDTQCPVCSPVATCSTDNYSIASCSGGGYCTQDVDCSNNPPSCPAGQTGQVVCQIPAGQQQGTCKTVSCQ